MRSRTDYVNYGAQVLGVYDLNTYTRMGDFVRSGDEMGIVTLRTNVSAFYAECPISDIYVGVGSGPWPPAILKHTTGSNGVGTLHLVDQAFVEFGSRPVPGDRHKERASEAFHKMKHLGAKDESMDHAEVYRNRPSYDTMIAPMGMNKDTHQVVTTPVGFYDAINAVFNFDYDPCPVNPIADAMCSQWGMRNYVNPPFKHICGFMTRAIEQAEHGGSTTVMLIPATLLTGVSGFRLMCDPHIAGVIFLRTGISFDGYNKVMPLPMMLVLVSGRCRAGLDIPMAFWDPFNSRRNVPTVHNANIPEWLRGIGWA